MLSLMKVALISKINWLKVAYVYFYGVPFSTEREWEKKKKSEKKKGKRLSPSAAFSDQILIPWQTIECTRLNNSRSLEFTREERGRNVGSFSWTAAARSSPKKSDGYFFFFNLFQESCFHPYIGVHILCTALDPFQENLRAYFKGIYFI